MNDIHCTGMIKPLVMACVSFACVMASGLSFAQTNHGPVINVSSRVKDLKITRQSRLPDAPAHWAGQDACNAIQPETAAGKQVAARGWHVTAEEKIGPYQAVSFAGTGKIEPATGGSCHMIHGEIGIYAGAALVAVIHSPSLRASIRKITPLESGGLRIWGGEILDSPVADLMSQGNDSLRIVPLAARETLCHGKATVPNIYNQPISKARKALIAAGWVPEEHIQKDDDDFRLAELAKRGIPEAADCSGMDFGFCWFKYTSVAGTLSVTTTGEDKFPPVFAYEITCGK